jgi:hypothetical protein
MLGSAPVFAKHWHEDGKHLKKHWDHDDDDGDHHAAGCYFQPHDVRLIGQYYASRPHDLPPGLQKKYKRTGHLPPGWERRIQPLPVVVERQLVPVPAEYRRGFIDGSVVVYAPHTGIVIDVVAVFGSR